MYVVIGSKKYTEITDLEFNPEVDITGSTVPINELWVSVKTSDELSVGSRVSLFDDTDDIWAKYWVTYSEPDKRGFVKIHGQSALFKLDAMPLDPIMYDGTTVGAALSSILGPVGEYTIDGDLAQTTLDGFCPKQSARARLQWICMASGAYVKEFFTDRITILPYSHEVEAFVESSRVFWRPRTNYKDYVTAVRVSYYAYDEGVPSRTDSYVEAGGKVYIQREDEITLSNPDVPSIALENVIEMENMTLMNVDNASDVAFRLSTFQFKRMSVELDIIDNGDVMPGQPIVTYASEDQIVAGFVRSASFRFGMRARASIRLEGCEIRDGGWLRISYQWQGEEVSFKRLYLPVGYPYETKNPYLQLNYQDGHKYVLRPDVETVTGTLASGGEEVTVQMHVALEYFEGTLHVVSTDELSVDSGRYEGNVVVVK